MINIIIRTFAVYLILIFVLRIMGKREVAEVGVFDLIVLLMIADVAVLSIEKIDEDFIMYIVPIGMLTVFQLLISYLSLKFNILRKIIDGNPSVVMNNGKFIISNMKKETLTVEELLTAARIEGYNSLNNIETAILETSGELSFFEKESNIKFKPYPVIVSGEIVKDNLKFLNTNNERITKLVNGNIKDIYYADYYNDSLFVVEKT